MKTVFVLLLAAASTGVAQTAAKPVVTSDPVVWSARDIFDRQSKFLLAAAEQMPEDKYKFSPTPEQLSFGRVIAHTTAANALVCHLLSDTTAPDSTKVPENPSKAALIAAFRASFDYCGKVLENLKDAKLGDPIAYPRRDGVPRARALVELTDDLEDHYSQLAMYLRLNGLTPPSATPAPAKK